MFTAPVREILLAVALVGVSPSNLASPAYAAVSNAGDKAAPEKSLAEKAAAEEKKAADAKAIREKALADKAATAINCPPQGDFSTVGVTGASKNKGAPTDIVELSDEIRVEITNLKVLWDHAKCATPPKKVLLYLDGRQITNVSPEPPTDPNQKELIFPLRRDDKSREAWTALLGRPTWKPRELEVSVGIEGLYPVPSTAKIRLELIPKMALAFWLAIVGLALWRVVKNRDMLRAPGPLPAAQRPYSLGRVQMMWWFYIALSSYLFIGIITGDYSSTITGTVLVLTGISAGTGLLATVIDKGHTVSATAGAPAAAGLLAPAPPAKSRSVGIWTDIVSDASGYSVHRYQMAVWSVVLGLIFIWNVYLVLAMPQFSETLLALMGISAGTYVSGKNVEP